ncbi:BTB domain-containing protein [Nephila pilipes]|uniref:BTB domain-containing protein n=1 Tax=Nephila pilipes TaxID=299642 RepID=A0A8X6PDL5_NEPPI|nr:BTB domain-containing protein [Nephila pilipes]
MLNLSKKLSSSPIDMSEQISSLPTDCTIVCKNGSVSAHRVVLCVASSFFMTMMSRNMSSNHIFLPEFDARDIEQVIDLLYGRSVIVDYDRMCRLIDISQKLGISAFDEDKKS